MTVEVGFLSEVAARVEELTGLQAKIWPGREIRIRVGDGREARASASGFWEVHLFERDGGEAMVGKKSHPAEVAEGSADVDVVTQRICDAVASLLAP